MAEKNSQKPVEDARVTGAKPVQAKEKKFQVKKLRENSMQLFHVTASTFDGAFYGQKETEMTIEKARAIIKKWLGKEQ